VEKKSLVMRIELNTKIKFNMQGPTQGLFLMFGYGNELGWFYKSPSLVRRNVIG
jgi:hypothetical protein